MDFFLLHYIFYVYYHHNYILLGKPCCPVTSTTSPRSASIPGIHQVALAIPHERNTVTDAETILKIKSE